MDPRIVLVPAITVITLGIVAVAPLAAWQPYFWVAAAVLYVGGDSLLTALIQRFDTLEEAGAGTRALCGPNPSLRCAFVTRLGFFAGFLAVYWALLTNPLARSISVAVWAAQLLPVAVSVAGGVAVVWNIYGMVTAPA